MGWGTKGSGFDFWQQKLAGSSLAVESMLLASM
jgi:hypothetical protein